MAQNLANQPDFAAAAQAMYTAGHELAKCPNLPAINQATAIIDAIQTLEQRLMIKIDAVDEQLLAVEGRLNRRIDAVDTRLSARTQAIEHNNAARLQNSLLCLTATPLTALHNSENHPIEHFPDILAEIQRLGGAQIDPILYALHMPVIGTIEQKRTRLRVACGFRIEGW